MKGKVRRQWVASILIIENTNKCNHTFKSYIETIMTFKNNQKAIAASLGFATSTTTQNKQITTAVIDYSKTMNEFIRTKLGNNKMGVLLFDDDFTRFWYRKFWNNFSTDKSSKKEWTTVGAQVTELTATIVSNADVPRLHNPDGLRIDVTIPYIISHIDFKHGYYNFLLTVTSLDGVDNEVVASVSRKKVTHASPNGEFMARFASAEQRRNRVMNAYGIKDEVERDRTMNNFAVIDVLQQNFKSYKSFCISLLTMLNTPEIFDLLDSGIVMLSPGDFPKSNFERFLIRQGVIKDPAYLASLLKTADPQRFNILVCYLKLKFQMSDASDEAETQIMNPIGMAALRIRIELGPLHCKINPAKDFSQCSVWFDCLLCPLYFMCSGI